MDIEDIRQLFQDRFPGHVVAVRRGDAHVLVSVSRPGWIEPYVQAIHDHELVALDYAQDVVLDHVRIAEADLAGGPPGPKWGP